jgi:hypothetical protein
MRPVPVPTSSSAPKRAAPRAQPAARLRPGHRGCAGAQLIPFGGVAGEIGFGSRPHARRGSRRGGGDPRHSARQRWHRPSSASASSRAAAPPAAVRGLLRWRCAGTPSCLPCGVRPARHRTGCLTCRETRGWLCPRTCASSPTASSIAASRRMIRSRVGSASARKVGSIFIAVSYKEIFISYQPPPVKNSRSAEIGGWQPIPGQLEPHLLR